MQTSTISAKFKLTRFDGLVSAVLLGLALGSLLLVWRGSSVGLQVIAVTPADGSRQVSTAADIRLTFDQPPVTANADSLLTFSPPVSGVARWQGSTLIFSPQPALAADTGYTVQLSNGLRSRQGHSLGADVRWQFRTRAPQLLYISPDEAGNDQIFAIDPAGGDATPLTDEPFGVFDYQLAPDASRIAYAALREDGGSDLWAISPAGANRSLLLACENAACNGATWAGDGQRILFEKRNFLAEGAAPGPPRLWWLDAASGESAPMFEDTQMLGYGASWAPNGDWLAYVAPTNQGVQVVNLRDDRSLIVPSRMGGLAVWQPRGNAFLVTDIQTSDAGFAVHILKAAPADGQLIDLSGELAAVEDSSPAWSPDGERIAFTRKVAGAAMGKQLWLMKADGSAARALTNDTNVHHGLPRWSPNGRSLAFQRFPLKEVDGKTSIWLLDVTSGQSRRLVENGNRPVWLP